MKKKWKNIALQKQLYFKNNVLKLNKSGFHGKKQYTHILDDFDASKGANFYCYNQNEEWNSLKKWAGSKIKFTNNGLKNMLRSEHICYNIFYPLEKIKNDNPFLLCKIMSDILSIKIDKVIDIRIEYSGNVPKGELLNDLTSFDAYIECLSKNKLIGVGFEIKYTEKSYPWGKTERIRMDDDNSIYNKVSKHSGVYIENHKENLATTKLKQVWRNHLLGIKMVDKDMIKEFYSIHFYPKGNDYQENVAKSYILNLKKDKKRYFIPLTFERFISICKQNKINDNWLEYFETRY